MTPSDCSTQFFRFQINDRGRPGPLTRVGPTLPGELTAMTATAGGGLIGYAINRSGCPKAGHGSYLGVFDPANGRARQWTGAPQYVTQLSMSANGRLLAFVQTLSKPGPGTPGGFEVTAYQVRTLATDAAPGPVGGRSRVAASISPQVAGLATPTVLLSRTGTSFYLCSQPWDLPQRGATKITETANIIAYLTATGKATGMLAAWTASYPKADNGGDAPLALGCSTMALDPSGRFLLVPYLETYSNPADPSSSGSLTAASINTATGATTKWTIPYGNGQGQDAMSIAW